MAASSDIEPLDYTVSIPVVYAAAPLLILANYFVLGRVLYYTPHVVPLHAGRLVSSAVALFVLAELLSGIGGAYAVRNGNVTDSEVATAQGLVGASLVLQLLMVVFAPAIGALLYRRCLAMHALSRVNKWPLWILFISSALLFIRCVYRIVECFINKPLESYLPAHIEPGVGADNRPDNTDYEGIGKHLDATLSPLLRYEAFLYVLEMTPYLLSAIFWLVLNPFRYLPKDGRTYLGQDGVTELQGPGWAADIGPQREKSRFWETNGVRKTNDTPRSSSNV